MGKTLGKTKDGITYYADDRLQIASVSWERVFLNIQVRSKYEEPLSFRLAKLDLIENEKDVKSNVIYTKIRRSVNVTRNHPISYESFENGIYTFRLNITILNESGFLENGQWYLIATKGNDGVPIISTISYEAVYDLPHMDKIFPYGKQLYSYTVRFTKTTWDEVNIIPILHSRFMIENSGWEDTLAVKERKTVIGKVRCIIKKCKLFILQTVYNVLSKSYKHDGTHILFMSETKPYLWGNLKYIDDRIKERGLDKTFSLMYTFRVAVGKHNSMSSWFKTMKRMAMQDYIFVDDYVPLFGSIKLRPETKLIQVWHAGEGFKAVGYGRFGQAGSPRPTETCHKMYDYAITGSKRLVGVYSEVFGIPEERILPLGMARLDGFLDEHVIEEKTSEFYSAHPECKGKKLILFSPTFRGPNQAVAYYDYDKLDMDSIYDFCGDEYIWAFKMHPFVKQSPPIEKYSDRIIDLGDYKNINDLYYVTDIMITDYSSAYYEYALLKRPVLFYTYDRVVYENIRGVHKSVKETAPGKVCDSFEELMAALRNKDYELEKTIKFNEENFGEYDGHAADRIIDTILLAD